MVTSCDHIIGYRLHSTQKNRRILAKIGCDQKVKKKSRKQKIVMNIANNYPFLRKSRPQGILEIILFHKNQLLLSFWNKCHRMSLSQLQ